MRLLLIPALACLTTHGMSELKALEKAAKAETPIQRLRVAVERYVEAVYLAAKGGPEVEVIAKYERRWRDALAQKTADNPNLDRDAGLRQMALDFFWDEKPRLIGDPAKLSAKEVLRLSVAARYFLRELGAIKGWQDYEESIVRWEEFLRGAIAGLKPPAKDRPQEADPGRAARP